MAPPEVILDRWVRAQHLIEPGFSGYVGKLDVERVESPSFRSFLYLIQKTMNEALRLEGENSSGGIEHLPFHFDYLDASDGIRNAHAFQHEGFSFIVVTLPLVELVWRLSHCLSRSTLVQRLLRLDPGTVDPDALQGLLFQIQLTFLVSHEYSHHIHRHCVESQGLTIGIWSEFPLDATRGSINSQAQELVADGYAAFIVLAQLLRGNRRQSALMQLVRTDAPATDGDELLLTCFFLALLAFFCAFWRGGTDIASIYQLRHPPPPVRINYALQVAGMWCGQNGSAPQSWFSPARFQALFRAAAEVIGGTVRQPWDAEMSFLRSPEGVQYDRQLFEKFETMRQKRDSIA